MSSFPIVIRMDDICPTMDKVKFLKYVDLFDELDIKPLLGIVPLCNDPKLKCNEYDSEFYKMIHGLYNKGYEIAMHGCHHVMTDNGGKALVTKRKTSEFAGKSIEEQRDILARGRAEFARNGLDTAVFMPPGHSYDLNTVRALKEVGFKYMSDGMSLSPYVINDIRFIPADSSYRLHKIGILTMCIHSNVDDFDKNGNFIKSRIEYIKPFSEILDEKTISYKAARVQELFRIYLRSLITGARGFVRGR